MPSQPAMKVHPIAAITVGKGATVMDAVDAMVGGRVGAAAVVDGGKLVGVFTERDVLTRVVARRLDPASTPVAEVMTRQLVTVREDADRTTCLRLMADHHIRHLPVVNASGGVVTMLSMRHLLRAEVQDLEQTVWQLVAENAIDGAGG